MSRLISSLVSNSFEWEKDFKTSLHLGIVFMREEETMCSCWKKVDALGALQDHPPDGFICPKEEVVRVHVHMHVRMASSTVRDGGLLIYSILRIILISSAGVAKSLDIRQGGPRRVPT